MAKKLTSVEKTYSSAVLHDIFEAGGLIRRPIRTDSTNYILYYDRNTYAKTLCDEIKFRTFNFYETNSAIARIASCPFKLLRDGGKAKTLTETQIANILAAFCSENEIFWDDVNTLKTTEEMATHRKSTLGNACWEFECFLSQQEAKGPSKFAAKYAAKRTSGGTTPRTPRASGSGAPKSGYKTSGGRSGEIKGLIGTPGEKVILPSSDIVYTIVCESTKTKKQYVFIDPISTKVDPNVIKLGDPSGYSSCKLFFRSVDEANAVIAKIKSDFTIPSHISGFSLARSYADPNGYFNVNTEVGPAYIKASKLNEAIEEELENTIETRKSRFPEIGDIDVYSEAMFRE